MPKSKCNKKVFLTKTVKKALEMKQNLIKELQECVNTYKYLFIFSMASMRKNKLKHIHSTWKHSLMFFGKNKVMMVDLGQNNLHQVSRKLRGEVGLLFANGTKKEVNECIVCFHHNLDLGLLEQLSDFMEAHLRQLGLPTAPKKGVVNLLSDYKVCKEGNVLIPEQAHILKLFGYKMAELKVTLKYMWDVQSRANTDSIPNPGRSHMPQRN
ncbi:hypothetical protein K5549_002152 [Capra hircus]|nr:hypothetical protein K5549_002152 [Capra hircus]